jgi:uroporphyrin-III C-methyltransferase/precorrin-2 dehydrogenase/sirohydrochlorin ferrochelatase
MWARRTFWENVLEGPIAEAVMNGREAVACRNGKALASAEDRPSGAVYLVGAGPGIRTCSPSVPCA